MLKKYHSFRLFYSKSTELSTPLVGKRILFAFGTSLKRSYLHRRHCCTCQFHRFSPHNLDLHLSMTLTVTVTLQHTWHCSWTTRPRRPTGWGLEGETRSVYYMCWLSIKYCWKIHTTQHIQQHFETRQFKCILKQMLFGLNNNNICLL